MYLQPLDQLTKMRSNDGFLCSESHERLCLFIPRTESNRIVRLVLDLICPVRSLYVKYLLHSWFWYLKM